MEAILAGIAAAAAGLIPILYALITGAILDTATGAYAAWKSGTFDAFFLPTFIKSHVIERIAPIMLVLLAGVAVGGTGGAAGLALITLGGTAATAYLASVVSSVTDNLSSAGDGTKELPDSVEVNGSSPSNFDNPPTP